MQYTAIVKNLIGLKPSRVANLMLTGQWSLQNYHEMRKFCKVNLVVDNLTANDCTSCVPPSEWKVDPAASFFYFCANETVNGFEFDLEEFPWHLIPKDMPVVSDWSSCIGTKPVPWDKFAMVFMGAQKNLGPAGCTVMVIREDLFGHADKDVPILCDWKTFEESPDTYYNTPAIFPMYVTGLNVAFMNQKGGVPYYEAKARQKAAILWNCIDSSRGFYHSKLSDKRFRSRINVIFRVKQGDKQLEELFVSEAAKAGIVQIRAHVANPGIRISMYNAMPVEGVSYLADFMRHFQMRHEAAPKL
jgi:phosphoserine aminotransferase